MDFNPEKEARDARKARVSKNERQRLQNEARAQNSNTEREQRKKEIEKTLAITRGSTASMGKFDKKLEGEKKLRGVKRKVRWATCIYLTCYSLTVFVPTFSSTLQNAL